MPYEYKSKDTVESYRAYYYFEKMELRNWKKRKVPKWITETRKMFE